MLGVQATKNNVINIACFLYLDASGSQNTIISTLHAYIIFSNIKLSKHPLLSYKENVCVDALHTPRTYGASNNNLLCIFSGITPTLKCTMQPFRIKLLILVATFKSRSFFQTMLKTVVLTPLVLLSFRPCRLSHSV